jgi:hypothetical protein
MTRAAAKSTKGTPAELYKVEACQVPRCSRSKVRWIPTATGARVPIDAGRDAHGLVVLDKHPKTGEWTARPFTAGDDPDRPRYAVHWTTCHEASFYRKVRLEADPHGQFPPIDKPSTSAGPCSLCGGRHLTKYGVSSTGPLCPACVLDLEVRRAGPIFRI